MTDEHKGALVEVLEILAEIANTDVFDCDRLMSNPPQNAATYYNIKKARKAGEKLTALIEDVKRSGLNMEHDLIDCYSAQQQSIIVQLAKLLLDITTEGKKDE